PALKDGEVLVRNLAFSFDPTQRGWMSMDTYIPALPLGQTMKAGTVGHVPDLPRATSCRDSSDGRTTRSPAAKPGWDCGSCRAAPTRSWRSRYSEPRA